MNWSTKRFVFFKEFLFVLTYVYVSSLLLSPENIYAARPYEWGTQ